MERQAAAWGTDSGGWGTQEAQAAGDTWGMSRHESEEAWGDHPESLLQPPQPQSHGILPTIPEHSSPGGQSSQIRRSLSDIGESQQSREDYDSWSGHQDLPAHHYAEGQQSQTLTATAAPSAMGSPAPHPAISLTEAVSRAHAQSLVGQKVSSASEAARKLEESRGRLNVYPTNTNTNSIGVSPAMRYEPLKDHSNHAPGAAMSSASAAAALLESTSNRLRAQGHGTSKPPQSTVTAPPGKTTWTYPKPVVPNGRPAAAIPPDASWTMTGGNTWSNKHRQTKSATVHWGQENENAWNQQIPQRGQQHQHPQHPQTHQGHQRPQHSKHHSHPGHPTHQQRPQPGQSQSWQGWGKDGWDQEQLSETETEETVDAWGQHGGDGWGQSGGDSWGQHTGGWSQQQQQQHHRQPGRSGGKPDRGRGRGGAKHPDDGWGGQADGWGPQGGWDQGEGGTWGQSNDGWSQTRGQGRGGQGQGHGRGHAPSDQEDNDWGQQQDSGWGKTADGGWPKAADGGRSKTADGGWGKTADAGGGKPADAGWGETADTGWGKTADAGWGAGGEWGAGGRAQSNSEWGAGPQSKETAASRAQVSEQQKAQILNSMLPPGQNQKGPSNTTTAQLQAMQQHAAQLQTHLAALQSAIAQGQKSGISAAQLRQQAAQTETQLAMVLGAMGQNQKNGNMTTAQHQAAQIQAAQLQAQLAATQGVKLPPKAKPQENRDVWEAYDADNGWGSVDSSDDEYDPNRRVHFSPKASDLWGGSPRSVPSKTLVQAQQQQGIATTPLNLTSNVRFVESRGAAFAFVSNAFFGNSRFARERIHWMFPANKDERVANMLAWVQKMSFNLATFGVRFDSFFFLCLVEC